MTAKELAQRLNGREYRHVVGIKEQREISDSGLVVAYGQSDDRLELEGAIYDEVEAYGGATAYIKNGAVLTPHYDCENWNECPAWDEYVAQAKTITAVWHDEGRSWTIQTDIPHETFFIYDDGELFSMGIVFRVEDTRDKPASEQLADLQVLWDMYGGEEGITAAFQKAAELDAAIEELRGICWCCSNAKPWMDAFGDERLSTCDYITEQGVLARGGGKCKCPHWEWRGPQKGEAVHG